MAPKHSTSASRLNVKLTFSYGIEPLRSRSTHREHTYTQLSISPTSDFDSERSSRSEANCARFTDDTWKMLNTLSRWWIGHAIGRKTQTRKNNSAVAGYGGSGWFFRLPVLTQKLGLLLPAPHSHFHPPVSRHSLSLACRPRRFFFSYVACPRSPSPPILVRPPFITWTVHA